MVYIVTGKDSFLIHKFITDLEVEKRSVRVLVEDSGIDRLDEVVAPELFSKRRIFVVTGLPKQLLKFLESPNLSAILADQEDMIFLEPSLDMRLSETKKILESKNITRVDCTTPTGSKLTSWIEARVQELGGKINKQTASMLANLLGAESSSFGSGFVESSLSLAVVDLELKKLVSFSDGLEISNEAVAALVENSSFVQVFDIVNAVIAKNKTLAFKLLEQFYESNSTTDTLGKTIIVSSLLADQFRSLLMVADFSLSKMSDSEILKLTGWKPFRLSILKKNSNNFSVDILKSFLSKFEALDLELKTGNANPKVLLNLIIASGT